MAGPPSQAGRFKPRKPAKKIRIGATTPAAAEAPPPAASARESRGSRGGRGGRGRGRGRGRGGRAPTPSGAVFFTGNAPPPVASKSKKSASAASKTSASASKSSSKSKAKTVTKKDSTEEIVIGQLDIGVGGAQQVEPAKETAKKPRRRVKSEEQEQKSRKTSRFEPTMDTYDSDSSAEERLASSSQVIMSVPPTELPFPVAELPVGIGGAQERPVLYSCQQSEEATTERNEPIKMELQKDAPLVSPFVDWKDAKLRQEERDSWFLVQMPTRLPELKSTGNAAVPDAVKSENPLVASSLTPDTAQSMPTNVATPATVTNGFDNALSGVTPGRLGKIVVYKSGKTELVMGGDNGSPEIRMNVTEGLPCGFAQQAVAIDTNENTYIPLGEVKKTVIVTPNVESAFSS